MHGIELCLSSPFWSLSISKWAVFENELKEERCKLPQRAANAFACTLGWEIATSGDEFPSWSPWPYFYMGVPNTFPKLGRVTRVHYGMDPRPQKSSSPDPRSGWKSTPLATHKNEINLTVATCYAGLETAARRYLMHCTAVQPRSLEGTLVHRWIDHSVCDAWPEQRQPRPTVTFPAAEHHWPLAGTKLFCPSVIVIGRLQTTAENSPFPLSCWWLFLINCEVALEVTLHLRRSTNWLFYITLVTEAWVWTTCPKQQVVLYTE